MKRYIRKGVPLEHRAHVWMGVSGAQARMDQNPGYYHRLLQGECSGRLEEAIWTGESRVGAGGTQPPGGNLRCYRLPIAFNLEFYFSYGKIKP